MKNGRFYLLAPLLVFSLAACKKNTEPFKNPVDPDNDSSANNLLQCSAQQIIDSAKNKVQLQGIGFGNEVWTNEGVPSTHHNEADYARVQAMHMNVIRFYMNYHTFEDDANPYHYNAEGFNWIDQNIQWAKKHGVYLILNMHVPQGGYQSQGAGGALWNNAGNQDRLTALWKAIAVRYRKEKQIVGYGLVNEPVPSTNMQQWSSLAQRIADSIRNQKDRHILFIERAIYVKGAAEDANLNFPVITGSNIAYEFHFYDPYEYTYQLFDWADAGDGGKYPDENILSYSNANWYTGTFNNPVAKTGNSNWKLYEGEKYKITDPKISIGLPALVGAGVKGKIYFDNLVIKEYNPDGSFSRTITTINPSGADNWSYWSANNSGSGDFSTATGVGDATSLCITGATADCNLSNYSEVFEPKLNYSYQISGYMKGGSVAADAECRIRIDFLTTNDPILPRNKTYLESALSRYISWGKSKNVPVYLGEYGAGVHCFENDKGGLQWVSDMIDILAANHLSYTYHVYHEDNFGLYYGYGNLPDPAKANQPLIDLFTAKLK